MKALIVIDYTYDFIADDGKLTVGEDGQALESRIVELANEFVDNNDYLVLAVDYHEENDPYHPESFVFPPHNIKGTKGIEQYGKLEEYYRSLLNDSGELPQNVYWMPKTRYSSFAGTDLELRLRARGIKEIHLVGVTTDVCVLHTAIEAFYKGFEIVIHKDGVESFNKEGHHWSLGHFKQYLRATIMENGEKIE